jgi:drug/metabolite transporter (DMT)-like permease
VFVNLVPVIALSLGVLFMDETMNVAQTMACVVVFSGVLLSQVRPLRPKPGQKIMASSEVS